VTILELDLNRTNLMEGTIMKTTENHSKKFYEIEPGELSLKSNTTKRIVWCNVTLLAFLLLAFAPIRTWACACGCGVFSIGTSSLLPTSQGGSFFFEYDYMDQNKNWSDTSDAPASDNPDKGIKTHFFTIGMQYMFDRTWGVRAEIPYWNRHFVTADEDTGEIVTSDHAALGDIRLKGIYSGFSDDMSSGLTLGIKLPTGDYKFAKFDRDTEIGTGSTDVLLGAYHMGNFIGAWDWFINGEVDHPVLISDGFRPGSEANAATGVYYGNLKLGKVQIAPVMQLIGAVHLHDRGYASYPEDTGSERILVSPGIEFDVANLRIYSDIAFPVYQHVKGNQIVAPALFKINLSYKF
jgi:hypothetical protein